MNNRHPERVFCAKDPPILAEMYHLGEDPSRKKRALDDVPGGTAIKLSNCQDWWARYRFAHHVVHQSLT